MAKNRARVPVSDVVAYFLQCDLDSARRSTVTPLKLQKLLYLAQGSYLASMRSRLFDETIFAYQHGPVVHPVYTKYRGIKTPVVGTFPEDAATDRLDEDVADFLGDVWLRWGGLTPGALRNLTHDQSPWQRYYEHDRSHIVIPDSALLDFFGREMPIAERVFAMGPSEAGPGTDGHNAGMFAPVLTRTQLPPSSRADRSARAAELRRLTSE